MMIVGLIMISQLLSAQGEYYYAKPVVSGATWSPWIYVNPNRFGSAEGLPWKNIGGASNSTGAIGTNIEDGAGVVTAVDLEITVASTEQFLTTPGSTGSNTGAFPDKVQSRGWGSTASFTFEIQDLSANTSYKIEFFTSLQSYHGTVNDFTVNGVLHTYTGVDDNTNNLLEVITTSDGAGTIEVVISLNTGTHCGLAGFIIYN